MGLETTRVLASQGAKVIMACRSLDKARLVEAEIRQTVADANSEVIPLDLSSLASVRECAATFTRANEHLDLLFKNAGIMAIPRSETADGFETQFGTNHLGHFALTGQLLPLLLAAIGATTISMAAHPGFATTNLQTTSATLSNARFERMMMPVIGLVLSQSALMGALPQLYAGLSPAIRGGELVGPGGFAEMVGYPRIIRSAAKEYDRPLAAKLWETSEKLTGVTYDALCAPAQITSAQS